MATDSESTTPVDEKPHHCSSCAHDNCPECGTDYDEDEDE